MEQQTSYYQDHGSNLNAIVTVPVEEVAAYEQNSAQDHYESSQILLEVVHCYIVLFVFSLDAK